jgi:hypothetical protein
VALVAVALFFFLSSPTHVECEGHITQDSLYVNHHIAVWTYSGCSGEDSVCFAVEESIENWGVHNCINGSRREGPRRASRNKAIRDAKNMCEEYTKLHPNK